MLTLFDQLPDLPEGFIIIQVYQYKPGAGIAVPLDLNGRSKRNGIIEMPVASEARQAIVSLNQTMFDGSLVSVTESDRIYYSMPTFRYISLSSLFCRKALSIRLSGINHIKATMR